MPDYMDRTLDAAVRSLRQVVKPGLAPENTTAREQVELIAEYLDFCIGRLDVLASREKFDVRHYLELAHELTALSAQLPDEVRRALAGAAQGAQDVLDAGVVHRGVLMEAAAEVAGAVTMAIRASADTNDEARRAIELKVMELARVREDVERAWSAPLGLDPNAHDLLDLSMLLAEGRTS